MLFVIDPGLATAMYSRGTAFDGQGEYDRAIAEYTRLIELKPDDAQGHNGRAWTYLKLGKNELALRDVDRAIKLNPKAGWYYDTRASVLQALGRRSSAAKDFKAALKLQPDLVSTALKNTKALAEKGVADAQYTLGLFYSDGVRLPVDPVAAYTWFAVASAAGNPEAEKRLAAVSATMSAAELAEAKERVEEWKRRHGP